MEGPLSRDPVREGGGEVGACFQGVVSVGGIDAADEVALLGWLVGEEDGGDAVCERAVRG